MSMREIDAASTRATGTLQTGNLMQRLAEAVNEDLKRPTGANHRLSLVCLELTESIGRTDPHNRYGVKRFFTKAFDDGTKLQVWTDDYVTPINCAITVFDANGRIIAQRHPGFGGMEELNPATALSRLLLAIEDPTVVRQFSAAAAGAMRKEGETLDGFIERLSAIRESMRETEEKLADASKIG